MNIVSANKDVLHHISRWDTRYLKIQSLIGWFGSSSEKIVEVVPEDGEYQSIYGLVNSIRQALRSMRKECLYECRVYRGKVFLMKTF